LLERSRPRGGGRNNQGIRQKKCRKKARRYGENRSKGKKEAQKKKEKGEGENIKNLQKETRGGESIFIAVEWSPARKGRRKAKNKSKKKLATEEKRKLMGGKTLHRIETRSLARLTRGVDKR